MSIARSPAARVHPDQCRRHVLLLEAARAYWQALPAPRRDAFRFLHVSTDEVFGSLGDDGAFVEETRLRSTFALFRLQGGVGSSRLGLGAHLRLPGLISNCSNNYGPYHFPEKLIPLMILNAVHGKPLPVYGEGSTSATGSMSTTTPGRST